MNVLINIANVVKNTLSYDESKIIIGRENATQQTFTNDYIVIDELVSISQGTVSTFDDVNETETFKTSMNGTFTIECYGDNAQINAINFLNLQESQEFYDAQKAENIIVYKTKNVNNKKIKTNSNYYARYEIEIVVNYVVETVIGRLRIDEIPSDFLAR